MPVRALTVLVVVMGLMIIGGIAALVVAVAGRMAHPTSVAAPARPVEAPAIDLAPGARIETMAVGSDKAVLDILLPDGRRQLLVIELPSGRRLSTIPLQTTK